MGTIPKGMVFLFASATILCNPLTVSGMFDASRNDLLSPADLARYVEYVAYTANSSEKLGLGRIFFNNLA